ncbi:MAG: FG-GAP repeat protein [Alphaproteobacteria bacterium]|nr:FG-GAP repeat protein [Alphaproteobacteria bacterium]
MSRWLGVVGVAAIGGLWSGSAWATGWSGDADWTVTGGVATGFGRIVAAAGDVDGDGYDDLLVTENDRVYLYSGGLGAGASRPAVCFAGPRVMISARRPPRPGT